MGLMMKLGIDFGTSYCTLSRLNPRSGLPEAIPDENGENKIPTLIFWGKRDIKVGKSAEELFTESLQLDEADQEEIMQRLIRSVKRNFSDDFRIYLPDGQSISALQAVTEVFKYLKKTAETGCSASEITSTTITHPVTFSEAQKKLLMAAAGAAGFREISLLPEPVAAVRGFLAAENHLGQNILVFDLGGGTFDLSFVHQDQHRGYHLPVVPLGKADCGGDDFDQLLYDYLEKVYLGKSEPRFSDDPERVNLSILLQCRLAKEKLSRNAEILFKASARHSAVKLSREQFDLVISPRVDECMNLTREMLRNIRKSGYEVDTVLMIGGSSRVICLRDELEKFLPVKPLQTMYADTAVAFGAVADFRETPHAPTPTAAAAPTTSEPPPTVANPRPPLPKAGSPRSDNESAAVALQCDPPPAATAEPGAPESPHNPGTDFLGGTAGCPEDEEKAVEWVRSAAKNGHAEAQRELGDCYFYGCGVAVDEPEAVKWYQLAAEQGNNEARVRLGDCYLYGWGVEKNEAEAFNLFKLAAEQENDEAQERLGTCYLGGFGVEANRAEAAKWFELAAEQGNADAQCSLGQCYLNGRGVQSNKFIAAKWFKLAAEQGNKTAAEKLKECR